MVPRFCSSSSFGHADAVILHGQDAVFLIAGDEDAEIALVHAHGGVGQALIIQLIDGVRSVGDQLPQENLFIGVDGVDHHIHQLFAFSLKFFLAIIQNLFYLYSVHRTR